MEPPSPWKKPNEIMQLHRLKKKKKALQERMKQPLAHSEASTSQQNPVDLDFSRILNGDKRRNPFSKSKTQESKRHKQSIDPQLEESSDKTLFALLRLPSKEEKPPQEIASDKLSTFSNLLQKYNAEHSVEPTTVEVKYKHLPIDWALKTKMRLMSPKPFPWSTTLKASEEASGITGFVRCIDTTTSPTLDTSPRARFHQTCLYWQHPVLPWLELFPRSSGKVAATSFLATNEDAKQALLKDWTESFRSVFQLLRARHCPYFYVCANSFTCLFRAGGLCGHSEPAALVAPTTRGFRDTLRQEDVEFTMPLRPDKKKLNNSGDQDTPKNSSFDSCYDTMEDFKSPDDGKDPEGSGDEDPHTFLSELGLETDVIRKINHMQTRLVNSAESNVDNAAESLVLVRGADAQALFNFLLNCKSVVSPTGPFAGVPPTLLAPTAFHGAALQSLKVRESVVHSEGRKYHSMELRGGILPSVSHGVLRVLRDHGAPLSATFQHLAHTRAFSAPRSAHDDSSKENEQNQFTKAFNKENLSDCGISEDMLQLFCSDEPGVVRCLDSVKYNPEDQTFTW